MIKAARAAGEKTGVCESLGLSPELNARAFDPIGHLASSGSAVDIYLKQLSQHTPLL